MRPVPVRERGGWECVWRGVAAPAPGERRDAAGAPERGRDFERESDGGRERGRGVEVAEAGSWEEVERRSEAPRCPMLGRRSLKPTAMASSALESMLEGRVEVAEAVVEDEMELGVARGEGTGDEARERERLGMTMFLIMRATIVSGRLMD